MSTIPVTTPTSAPLIRERHFSVLPGKPEHKQALGHKPLNPLAKSRARASCQRTERDSPKSGNTPLLCGLLTYYPKTSAGRPPGWLIAVARCTSAVEVVFTPIPAVLSAIPFPELLRPRGTLNLPLGNVRLLAGILVAWHTRNVLLTIVVGMAALWILTAIT